jgi:hypothetical protein
MIELRAGQRTASRARRRLHLAQSAASLPLRARHCMKYSVAARRTSWTSIASSIVRAMRGARPRIKHLQIWTPRAAWRSDEGLPASENFAAVETNCFSTAAVYSRCLTTGQGADLSWRTSDFCSSSDRSQISATWAATSRSPQNRHSLPFPRGHLQAASVLSRAASALHRD